MRDDHSLAAVVARDSSLPGLSSVLDAELIARHLGVQKNAVQLDYIRYKPQTNCLARFVVQNPDIRYVYTKTFAEPSLVKLENAASKTSIGCQEPLKIQPDCLLYRFPTDARMKSLSKLIRNNSWLAERFVLFDTAPTMDVLAYKPERRCVLKVRSAEATYVLKLFASRGFDDAYNAARFSKDLSVRVPKLQKKSRRHRALLYEYIEGPTLRDEVVAGRGVPGCAVAGKVLADLHSSSVNRAPSVVPAAANHSLLAWLLPEAAQDVQFIVASANAAIYKTIRTRVPLHGDFYDKQLVLTEDESAVVVDMDDSGIGDHRIDLATFIAHLEGVDPDSSGPCVEAFLSTYTAYSSNSLVALSSYVALATLQLAHHGFRRGLPQWAAHTSAAIQRAKHWLEQEGDHW